jgi:hypothetical protein
MLVTEGRPGNPGTAFIQEMMEYIQQRRIILCLDANKSLKSGRSGINRLATLFMHPCKRTPPLFPNTEKPLTVEEKKR